MLLPGDAPRDKMRGEQEGQAAFVATSTGPHQLKRNCFR